MSIKIIPIIALVINILFASKLIKIDLSKQKLYAIENGEVVFSGDISSGKKGYRTPTGTFKIIDKERFHISNKYPEPNGGAKMPYMHRLTNFGLAIHQGYLPGYPASHGCIRVSKTTAKKLWRWSREGIKVKIYGDASEFIPKKPKRVARKRVKKHKKYIAKKRVKRVKKHFSRKRYKRYYSKRVRQKRYARRVQPRVVRVRRIPVYQVVEELDTW